MSSILNAPRFAGAIPIDFSFPDKPTVNELAKTDPQAFEQYADSQTRRAVTDAWEEAGRLAQQGHKPLPPTFRPQSTPDLSAMLFKDNELIGVVYGDGDADFRSDAYENSVTGKGTDWLELAKQAAYDLGAELMVKPSTQETDTTA